MSDTVKDGLRECPFCGSKDDPKLMLLDEEDNPFDVPYVVCQRCGGGVIYNDGETAADAIAAWNRRAAPAAVSVNVEEIALLIRNEILGTRIGYYMLPNEDGTVEMIAAILRRHLTAPGDGGQG